MPCCAGYMGFACDGCALYEKYACAHCHKFEELVAACRHGKLCADCSRGLDEYAQD